MELVLKDTKNKIILSDEIFKYDFNESLIHQITVAYLAGARQGSRAQKNRAQVSGSSKKPWRQKGTGRARAGSVKSPIWRSGGVTFAAKPQDHQQKVNKKMYRGALKSILSELIRQERLILCQKFSLEMPKTKLLLKKIKKMTISTIDKVLIIINVVDRNLFLAARNLYNINVRKTINIDPVSLISSEKIIMTVDAIKKFEEMLL